MDLGIQKIPKNLNFEQGKDQLQVVIHNPQGLLESFLRNFSPQLVTSYSLPFRLKIAGLSTAISTLIGQLLERCAQVIHRVLHSVAFNVAVSGGC